MASSPRRLAQQMAYCLRKASVVEVMGSRGHAATYRIAPRPPIVSTLSTPDDMGVEA